MSHPDAQKPPVLPVENNLQISEKLAEILSDECRAVTAFDAHEPVCCKRAPRNGQRFETQHYRQQSRCAISGGAANNPPPACGSGQKVPASASASSLLSEGERFGPLWRDWRFQLTPHTEPI